MKKYAWPIALLVATAAMAQAPEKMSYQAVIRDGSNALVANTVVGMRLSILQGSSSGPAVYVETQTPTSNTNGLVSVEVGNGAVVSGSMAAIDWSAGPFFMQTETDPTGGVAYSITGVQQLLSVPYALFAANGGTVGPQGPQGPAGPMGPAGPGACDMIRTGDGRAVVYTAGNAYGFGVTSTGSSGWGSIILDGPVLGALASDTLVVLYTATTAYSFGPTSTGGSGWISTILDGVPVGAVSSSARIVVYTNTTAYGTGRTSTGGTGWASTLLTGTPVQHLAAGNRIVVYTDTNAYGFGITSTGSSGWASTILAASPAGHIGTR